MKISRSDKLDKLKPGNTLHTKNHKLDKKNTQYGL